MYLHYAVHPYEEERIATTSLRTGLAMTGSFAHFKAPRSVLVFLRSIGNAHPFIGGHLAAIAVVFDLEGIIADTLPVTFSGNTEALCQFTGAVCVYASTN